MTYTIMDDPVGKALPLLPDLSVLLMLVFGAQTVSLLAFWAFLRVDKPALKYGLIVPAIFAPQALLYLKILPFMSAPGILPLALASLTAAAGAVLPLAAIAAIVLSVLRQMGPAR